MRSRSLRPPTNSSKRTKPLASERAYPKEFSTPYDNVNNSFGDGP